MKLAENLKSEMNGECRDGTLWAVGVFLEGG